MKLLLASLALLWGDVAGAWPEYGPVDWQRLYYGVGLGQQSVPGRQDNLSMGQLMLGYPTGEHQGIATALELGWQETAEVDHDGPWVTAVAQWLFAYDAALLGRLGLDLGDEFGPMAGLGFVYAPEPDWAMRLEAVGRTESNGLQLNFIWFPGQW